MIEQRAGLGTRVGATSCDMDSTAASAQMGGRCLCPERPGWAPAALDLDLDLDRSQYSSAFIFLKRTNSSCLFQCLTLEAFWVSRDGFVTRKMLWGPNSCPHRPASGAAGHTGRFASAHAAESPPTGGVLSEDVLTCNLNPREGGTPGPRFTCGRVRDEEPAKAASGRQGETRLLGSAEARLWGHVRASGVG